MSKLRKAIPVETEELCSYGCGKRATYQNYKGFTCERSANSCPENRRKNSERLKIAYANGTAVSGYVRFRKRSPENRIAWSKGKTSLSDPRVGKPYEEMFCKNSSTGASHIRNLVVKETLLPYFCQGDACSLSNVWLNKPLKLQLDHIDGDRTNNEIENLRWLCPNCHSQTETFCNNTRKESVVNRVSDERFILALNSEPSIRQALLSLGLRADSGNYKRAYRAQTEAIKTARLEKLVNSEISNVSAKAFSVRVRDRAPKVKKERTPKARPTKIQWPSVEEVHERVLLASYRTVGLELGVSDVAVRKFKET